MNNPLEEMPLAYWLAEAIAAYTEEPITPLSRVRLQKTAYLLKCLGCKGFEDLDFDYESRGPYSRWVSDALHDIVTANYIRECGNSYGYQYNLTERGKVWVGEQSGYLTHRESLSLLKRWIIYLKGRDVRALELACCVDFISKSRHKETPWKRVFERNPYLQTWRESAENILKEIERWKRSQQLTQESS